MSLIVTVTKLFPDLQEIKYTGLNSECCFRFTAVKNSCNVSIKLFFEPFSRFYNNYIVESQIYSNVLTSLKVHTPHIPVFFGMKKTDISALERSEIPNIQKWESNFDMRSAQVVAVKNLGGNTLRSMWIEEYDNPHIAFQVLYTIACFERVGLKHNNINLDNIVVRTFDKPAEFRYCVGEKIISFTTTYCVTLMNYERSSIYHKDVERNGYLDFLQEKGQTSQYNGLNDGHDMFKFLRCYDKGSLRIWLEFLCPKIFSVNFENDSVPQNINPRNFIPDTLTILKNLVESFSTDFRSVEMLDNSEFEYSVWSLPRDRAMVPVSDKTKFSVTNAFVMESEICPYMLRELLDIGYNWKLHATKLFVEVYNDTSRTVTESYIDIQKACIKLTNPFNTEQYTAFESSLQQKVKIPLKIEQKTSRYQR